MQTHDLQQGSQAWHEFRATHFGASEAPAMLGISPYKTRSQLLHEKHTGITPDVDAGTQSRFDDGHRFEALARPLAEKIIGQELSPVTISEGKLSASLDGITFDDTVIFEHKTLNNDLRALFAGPESVVLPDLYAAQLEQQLMLSGAEYCLFMASQWDKDGNLVEEKHGAYVSNPGMRNRLLQGWAQFVIDLETYVPPEVIPEVVAAPIKDLPAITYKMDGMHLSTNLRNDVKPAILALVEQSKKPLVNDQDFADLDALCKKFKQAEEQCALVQSQAVGEIKDVDAFCRELKELSEIMRQARIAGEKAVTSEKDARKLAILTKAKAEYAAHLEALEVETKPILLFKGPADMPDFAGAMKGLKKLSAMQESVDNALRDGKMLADAAAQDIRAKLAWCKEHASGMSMLFPDLQQIIAKPMDDFTLTITSRIDKHKADEAAKLEAQRVQMQAEADAKAKTAQDAILAAERAKMEAEVRAKAEEEARARGKAEFEAIESRRKAAQIAEQSKPNDSRDYVENDFGFPIPAKKRPTRKQIIEAVAEHFGMTVLEAYELLRSEFAEVAA